MARSNYRGSTSRRAAKDIGRRVKKKPCALCRDGVEWVDYKDVPLLRKYMSDRGKIRSRRVTGNCAQHQRDIAEAIKTARELVLLPYTQRTVTERPGGRGGRGERGDRGPGGPSGRDHDRGPRDGLPRGGAGVEDVGPAAGEAGPGEADTASEEGAAEQVELVPVPVGTDIAETESRGSDRTPATGEGADDGVDVR
jgi:small subunit ribosomal protein S18